ncbi:cytochrome [Arthrobacter sp. I2-34]|uniref:Cytochrome n=1 Tax=Arthrobacter hankyongi TaxID=2904801 RepID=A0ABS9LBK4_9MICC|nr:cytochrome [Arthrobacter hankyongi]MCG2624056.1 cytochrome [Arthrobacter hankyongi]
MTSPALAHQTANGRMYSRSLNESPTVPSITTVISQAPSDMSGWAGHMAATTLARDPGLAAAAGNPARLKSLAKEASAAADRFRNAAAERGDRVHFYAEQVALRALGRPHQLAEAREELRSRGEDAFAARLDEWWQLYGVEPLVPEITVWNQEVGYAGTLDLVARIGGRLCLIDFKTKGTDRSGQVKAMDEKVVMQLVAGMKAQESLLDAGAGSWEPWAYGSDPILLGVAVGETEVRPMQANPAVLRYHWYKFCALRRVWETQLQAAEAGRALLPIGPPAVHPEAAGAAALD